MQRIGLVFVTQRTLSCIRGNTAAFIIAVEVRDPHSAATVPRVDDRQADPGFGATYTPGTGLSFAECQSSLLISIYAMLKQSRFGRPLLIAAA